jgi:hypothetical protein
MTLSDLLAIIFIAYLVYHLFLEHDDNNNI